MIQSKNPATGEVLATYDAHGPDEVERRLSLSEAAFASWQYTSFEERASKARALAQLFRNRKEEIGNIISSEMGRPIAMSPVEAEKCAWALEYYADHAERFLEPEVFPEGAGEGEVRYDPLGPVLAVMPWNFPFWQIVRFAAPALMAGNVVLVKHASNVPQSAALIEALYAEAGYPSGVYQNLFVPADGVAALIDDRRIVAVTLTGSVRAGSAVAERAGKNIKKSVLELGGSDAFIVLPGADVALAAKEGTVARLQNNGQSCIAAKRFLVHASVYDEFLAAFTKEFSKQVIGDQLDPKTTIGPLAMEKFVGDLNQQVADSVAKGARIHFEGDLGGRGGAFFAPMILTDVAPGMPAYHEEFFGPVAIVIKVADDDEAIRIANDSVFGLGSSVWTDDVDRAMRFARRLESGSVFINKMVKSDPRIPFGGIKESGYGRELGGHGIREFVNAKTVSLERPQHREPGDAVE